MPAQVALTHRNTRKRVFKKLEPYPSKDKWKNIVDRMIYPMALMGIGFTLPQVFTIWIDKNTDGVSIYPWAAFLIIAGFMFFYGALHKEKQLMIVYLMWMVVHSMVVIGLLVHG